MLPARAAAQSVPTAGRATPSSEQAAPKNRSRYAHLGDARENIFGQGAYAQEWQQSDFMARLQEAEARDDEVIMAIQDRAGRRVEPRIFGETSSSSPPPQGPQGRPQPAAPSRLDPAAAAAQRGYGHTPQGGFGAVHIAPVDSAIDMAALHEVAARRAQSAQQQRQQQEPQRQQQWQPRPQPQPRPQLQPSWDQHQHMSPHGWAYGGDDPDETLLRQQPQFLRAIEGAVFPPPGRDVPVRPPVAAQRQQLQSAPGASSPFPQGSSPYPQHASIGEQFGSSNLANGGAGQQLYGMHQCQPPAKGRRAGEATFSLFDANAPCAPDAGHGGTRNGGQSGLQIVAGVLRRNDSRNNYETLARPAGAAGGPGACPGAFGGGFGAPVPGRRKGAGNGVDAHASSLGGIL